MAVPGAAGAVFGVTENLETQIWPGMSSGEIYRQGANWWWPEPWGCWTKPGVARLAFIAALPKVEAAVLYVGLKGVQGMDSRATVTAVGFGKRELTMPADKTQWLIFRIPAAALDTLPRTGEGVLIELRFSADKVADFRAASIGVLGFMIARSGDMDARMAFMEGMVMGNIQKGRFLVT